MYFVSVLLYIIKHSRIDTNTEKKVEPKQLHLRAVLENGATLEDGALLNNHVQKTVIPSFIQV